MSTSCWQCLFAFFLHGRANDQTEAITTVQGGQQANPEEGEADPERPPYIHPGDEPETEPWSLSRDQAEHLRQAFPNFREQPLTTPSDAAFAAWLEQGLRQ
jgi:hypothetical protein